MLKEHPVSRPNIYQVLREACLMQGIELPIKDVCSCLRSVKANLTCVDICQENPVGKQTQSTTPDARKYSLAPCNWSCVLPARATKASYP